MLIFCIEKHDIEKVPKTLHYQPQILCLKYKHLKLCLVTKKNSDWSEMLSNKFFKSTHANDRHYNALSSKQNVHALISTHACIVCIWAHLEHENFAVKYSIWIVYHFRYRSNFPILKIYILSQESYIHYSEHKIHFKYVFSTILVVMHLMN